MISQTAEYALRSVAFLGGRAGRPATAREIAAGTGLPEGYLAKVLQALVRAGLIAARRGLGGGHVLSCSPEEVTMLDVIRAVDPPQAAAWRRPCGAGASGGDPVARQLDRAAAGLEAMLRGITMGRLAAEWDEG